MQRRSGFRWAAIGRLLLGFVRLQTGKFPRIISSDVGAEGVVVDLGLEFPPSLALVDDLEDLVIGAEPDG